MSRADIARTFAMSEQQASIDFRDLIAAHPGITTYDKSRRRYVPGPVKLSPPERARLDRIADALGWS